MTQPKDTKKYHSFLKTVVSTEKIWAIWCGNSWANVADPADPNRTLFFLWPTKHSASDAFKANREKFPREAVVESIDLKKWVDRYTSDLLSAGALAFVFPDNELNGLAVSPEALSMDIQRMMYRPELQGSDLAKISRKSKH